MIVAEAVSKSFNTVKAVDQVSFDVNEGESLILLGRSGCGKTTTLRMLNRLTEPTSGLIRLNGQDISKQKPEILRRGIGYVLQQHGLFPHYTVADNIAIVPRLLHWDKKAIEQRTEELLEKLNLPPGQYLHAYPAQLSGGEQQRVGLARALMANPPLLLMDEPFGALDPLTRTIIRSEFKQLDELKRKTMIMVTHDVVEAFELADRICLMDQGRIIQIGTPYELLFTPADEFVSSFLVHQRLQLELKALSLKNIWNYLPAQSEHPAGSFCSNNISLWEALALLLQSGQPNLRCSDDSGRQKTAGYREIMGAYEDFKNAKT